MFNFLHQLVLFTVIIFSHPINDSDRLFSFQSCVICNESDNSNGSPVNLPFGKQLKFETEEGSGEWTEKFDFQSTTDWNNHLKVLIFNYADLFPARFESLPFHTLHIVKKRFLHFLALLI